MASVYGYYVLWDALQENDKYKRIQTLRHLIERGADTKKEGAVDVNSHDAGGCTVLMNTAIYGLDDCLRLLLNAGANVNQSNNKGQTALIEAASCGDDTCVRLLLDAGANINQSNNEGETSLIKAARQIECVRLSCSLSVRVIIEDGRDKTALIETTRLGYVECVKVLLEAGADVNHLDTRGDTALTIASDESIECVQLVVLFLEAGANVNVLNEYGDTALMNAGGYGHVESVRLLLEAGANVNHSNKVGETTLMAASCCGDVECLRLLLEAGADVNHSDSDGETSLMKAADSGCFKCVKLLLEAGANVSVDKNRDNALICCLTYYDHYDDTKSDSKQLNKHLQPIQYALMRWPYFKLALEYLISENCNLSQVSYHQISKEPLEEEDRLDILKLLFACGLPRHLCYSFIVEQDTTSINSWMETVASQPNTLKSLCVFKIRKSLGHRIKFKVRKLYLPNMIQNLILLKGILSLECFI